MTDNSTYKNIFFGKSDTKLHTNYYLLKPQICVVAVQK